MKNINGTVLTNLMRLLATEGKPFYADEYDLSGGDMRDLHLFELVKPTGNTKQVEVNIVGWFGGPDRYIKVDAKEWRLNPDVPARVKQYIENAIADAKAVLNAAVILGIAV
jgi:hypothetical protein